jgi:hypothetical protein
MSTGGLNRVSWKLAVQSNLEEIVRNQNGIKVLLSMVRSEAKHLPPHARELLNTPQRIITVAVKDEDQQEGEEGADGGDTGGVSWQRCSAVKVHLFPGNSSMLSTAVTQFYESCFRLISCD